MGVKIYYLVVAAVVVLGLLLPQCGKQKKLYIVIMAALHAFVCGWRYMYLTGDLIKYANGYYVIAEQGWFSEDVFQGGRNAGFFWLEKLIAMLSDSNFQVLLIVIAVIVEIAVAYIIYRYSPKPWLSYLIWNCVGFYVFGFSAIKQALAMALVLLAFDGIMKDRPGKFLFWTLLAGFVHAPAFIFLPAYWLAKRDLTLKSICIYIIAAALIFVFRNRIVVFISEFYYDETDFVYQGGVGGRFIMICLLLFAGLMLKGRGGRGFNKVFNLIVAAAILQMFSGFDNVFTRLTDYYLQLLIIYVPMMFTDFRDEPAGTLGGTKFVLSSGQRKIAVVCIVIFAIWFYSGNYLRPIEYAVDDYTNYRFCWEVTDTQ